MSTREPWLGVTGAAGLVVMLAGDGVADLAGLAIATVPLIYGLVAAVRHWHEPQGARRR